jgi:hypothetical protein
MRKQIFSAIAVSLVMMASSIMAAEQNKAPVPVDVLSLCQALEQVKAGDHQILTVSAIYMSGAEDSFLYDPKCHAGEPSTWVELTPNLKNEHDLERILKKSNNRAYVQFEGDFFGPKSINPDTSIPDVLRKSGRHYGHLGGYKTMLLVHAIKQVKPVPQEIPFFHWPNGSAVSEATGNELPVVTHADVPSYPPMARIAHITGTVQIEVTIKNGVMAITEVKSPAPPILVNATLENLKTWKFASDANAAFRITYIYEVEREGTALPGNPRIEMQLPNLIKITAQPPKTTSNYQLGAVVGGPDTMDKKTGDLHPAIP